MLKVLSKATFIFQLLSFELINVQRVSYNPDTRVWEPPCDCLLYKLEKCKFDRSVDLVTRSVLQWLSRDMSVSLVLHDEMLKLGDQGTIIMLSLYV